MENTQQVTAFLLHLATTHLLLTATHQLTTTHQPTTTHQLTTTIKGIIQAMRQGKVILQVTGNRTPVQGIIIRALLTKTPTHESAETLTDRS